MIAKKHKTKADEKIIDKEKLQAEPVPQSTTEAESEMPFVIPEEEIAQLRSEQEQALAKANEYLEGWRGERGGVLAEGVKMIETDGKYFDPNLHEAISNEDSPDHECGQIIDVVQPGYILGERVIRPARVRVAR